MKEVIHNTNLKPLRARSGSIAGNPWDADNRKELRDYIIF